MKEILKTSTTTINLAFVFNRGGDYKSGAAAAGRNPVVVLDEVAEHQQHELV